MNRKTNPQGGRPLFDGKDYDTVLRKLETAWALDCSDAEAARFASISPASLSDFLKKHPDIAERKLQLKDQPMLSARSTLLKAINRGDADLALKYLERKRRDEFATKQETEHSGEIKTAHCPIDVKAIIHDPVKAAAAIRLVELLSCGNDDTAAIDGQSSPDTPASPAEAKN